MYAKIFAKYQANNPDNSMWFEPVQVPDQIPGGAAGGQQYPVGFETPPGGEIGSSKHVLNDHYYCCVLGPGICKDMGEPDPKFNAACDTWVDQRFTKRNEDAVRLGLPLFISEFGACLTDEPCTAEIKRTGDQSDKYLVGWAYWQFKFFEDLTTSAGTGSEGFYNADGTLQDWKVKALARSYMMATQGRLTGMDFNSTTSAFVGEFTVDTSITAPTVTYLNSEYWYPNGYTYTLMVNGKAPASKQYTVDVTDPQRLSIQFTDKALNA